MTSKSAFTMEEPSESTSVFCDLGTPSSEPRRYLVRSGKYWVWSDKPEVDNVHWGWRWDDIIHTVIGPLQEVDQTGVDRTIFTR